ncbi:MAG: hypothetical protein WCP14_00590 [bacterium]
MSVETELTKKGDERQNYYNGLASRMGFISVVLSALVMSGYFAYLGDYDKAFLIQEPAVIGVLVFMAFYIKWKVGNRQ